MRFGALWNFRNRQMTFLINFKNITLSCRWADPSNPDMPLQGYVVNIISQGNSLLLSIIFLPITHCRGALNRGVNLFRAHLRVDLATFIFKCGKICLINWKHILSGERENPWQAQGSVKQAWWNHRSLWFTIESFHPFVTAFTIY